MQEVLFCTFGSVSLSQQKAAIRETDRVLPNVVGCKASFIYFDDHLGYV